MNSNFIKKDTEKDRLINSIIDIEWEMFDKVNNIGGRAACQDDYRTFYINRYSQFSIYSVDILAMYKEDLDEAAGQGRNLITEKYAYMMEFTEPDYFKANLEPVLPKMSKEKAECVGELVSMLVQGELELGIKYPTIRDKSRPLAGTSKYDTSFLVYTTGELKTYSERTLKAMLDGVKMLVSKGINPSMIVHDATVRFYGYENLDDAEMRMRNQ